MRGRRRGRRRSSGELELSAEAASGSLGGRARGRGHGGALDDERCRSASVFNSGLFGVVSFRVRVVGVVMWSGFTSHGSMEIGSDFAKFKISFYEIENTNHSIFLYPSISLTRIDWILIFFFTNLCKFHRFLLGFRFREIQIVFMRLKTQTTRFFDKFNKIKMNFNFLVNLCRFHWFLSGFGFHEIQFFFMRLKTWTTRFFDKVQQD